MIFSIKKILELKKVGTLIIKSTYLNWPAAVHGDAKSWTRLSDWTELNWNEFPLQLKKKKKIDMYIGIYIKNSMYFCGWFFTPSSKISFRTIIWLIFLFKKSNKLFFEICCCSVTQSYLTLCKPMDGSMQGIPVLHHLPEFAQTHVHWADDAIQPSYPVMPPSLPALNIS